MSVDDAAALGARPPELELDLWLTDNMKRASDQRFALVNNREGPIPGDEFMIFAERIAVRGFQNSALRFELHRLFKGSELLAVRPRDQRVLHDVSNLRNLWQTFGSPSEAEPDALTQRNNVGLLRYDEVLLLEEALAWTARQRSTSRKCPGDTALT